MRFHIINITNVNCLSGIKDRPMECVIKRKHSSRAMASRKSSHQTAPLDGTIRYSHHLGKPPTSSWSSSKMILAITLFTILPLLWWFSSSNASIELFLPQSHPLQAPKKTTASQLSVTKSTPILPAPTVAAVTEPEKSALIKVNRQPASTKAIASIPDKSAFTQLNWQPAPTVAPLIEPDKSALTQANLSHPILRTAAPSSPWLHLTIKPGDNLSLIFKTHQLSQQQLHHILELEEYTDQLGQLYLGQQLHIKPDQDGNIENIILSLKDSKELLIYQEDNNFVGEIRQQGVHTERVFVHGVVESSLSVAARKVGLSTSILAQLVEIFQWHIGFGRDIRPGDQFNLFYEQHRFEGDVEEGKILAAEFINQGKVFRALRYTDDNGYTDYYTPLGESLRKVSLLRAPVEKYTRISSPFGDRRHPIFRRTIFHSGTDYAAPWGTPVVAAGDGIVKFVGRKGGYGKVITLKHNERVKTLYAHLLKYADLTVGEKVSQGEIIGYVGQSGRATGPHLHFEIQLDEVAVDPQKIELPLSMPIPEEIQVHFMNKILRLMTKLDATGRLTKPTMQVENKSPSTPTMATMATNTPVESTLKQHTVTYAITR